MRAYKGVFVCVCACEHVLDCMYVSMYVCMYMCGHVCLLRKCYMMQNILRTCSTIALHSLPPSYVHHLLHIIIRFSFYDFYFRDSGSVHVLQLLLWHSLGMTVRT